MNLTNQAQFVSHVVECYPQEACGIIKDNTFYPYQNVHEEPVNYFAFSKEASFGLATTDTKYSIIHSHTMDKFDGDPRTPSLEDMEGRNNTLVPWGIVHCDGENVSDVLWFGDINIEILLGRTYISNVFDCFTLARDFFYNNFTIDIGLHPRPADWQEWNPHYIEDNFVSTGFSVLTSKDTLKFGDILLYRIGSSYINHIGIYLQDDTFIHHLHNRKSCEDSVCKWSRQFVKAIRLEAINGTAKL